MEKSPLAVCTFAVCRWPNLPILSALLHRITVCSTAPSRKISGWETLMLRTKKYMRQQKPPAVMNLYRNWTIASPAWAASITERGRSSLPLNVGCFIRVYLPPGINAISFTRNCFRVLVLWRCTALRDIPMRRSEEHTSELQSRFDLVCRLLLEE